MPYLNDEAAARAEEHLRASLDDRVKETLTKLGLTFQEKPGWGGKVLVLFKDGKQMSSQILLANGNMYLAVTEKEFGDPWWEVLVATLESHGVEHLS